MSAAACWWAPRTDRDERHAHNGYSNPWSSCRKTRNTTHGPTHLVHRYQDSPATQIPRTPASRSARTPNHPALWWTESLRRSGEIPCKPTPTLYPNSIGSTSNRKDSLVATPRVEYAIEASMEAIALMDRAIRAKNLEAELRDALLLAKSRLVIANRQLSGISAR